MSDTQSTHDYVLHHGVVTQGNITTSQEAEISIQEVGFTLSGPCREKPVFGVSHEIILKPAF